MEATINRFIERLKENRSLRPLYRNVDFCVELKGKRVNYLLAFDKEGCRRIGEGKADVTISGKDKDLVHLLEGKERLLMMVQRQALDIQGAYRRQLKLESLFLLNGTEKYLIYQLS
ncbi:MAG TPA: SCP2 sterol-binding domain-containing protein [Bacillales bacterium]|nr:SCP2 sterol-binding domain-containing protein [Bacillales bacterium]